MRMKPMMSRAKDLFSSSSVRALRNREQAGAQNFKIPQNKSRINLEKLEITHADTLLDRIVHGLADV